MSRIGEALLVAVLLAGAVPASAQTQSASPTGRVSQCGIVAAISPAVAATSARASTPAATNASMRATGQYPSTATYTEDSPAASS